MAQAASEKTFNDAIIALQNLAEQKRKNFELDVFSGNTDADKTIPIESTLLHDYSITCKV